MTKHLIMGLGALALLASCAGGNKNEFTLQGIIEGCDGKQMVFVLDSERMDTVEIKDGIFSFTDTISHPRMATLTLAGTDMQNRNGFATFYIDPGCKMVISLPTDSFPGFTMKGSPSQDEYTAYQASMSEILSQMTPIQEQYRAAQDVQVADSLDKLLNALNEQRAQVQKDYIMQHPASYVAAQEVRMLCGRLAYDELKALYDNFTPELQQTENLQGVKKELDDLEATLPGKPAYIIAKKDLNGNDFNMADLKGKVILLDFWASWCKPCRASNPHVKALYDQYHAKGLEVVMVADNDSNPEEALKAIKEDGTEKFYHVLRGLKKAPEGSGKYYDDSEDVSKHYAIHFLPTKYLIDRDLNIIGKFNDEELDEKLKELF